MSLKKINTPPCVNLPKLPYPFHLGLHHPFRAFLLQHLPFAASVSFNARIL
jgi:hypothetical protein